MGLSKFYSGSSGEAIQKKEFFENIRNGNVEGVRKCIVQNPDALTWRTGGLFVAPKSSLEVALRTDQKQVFDALLEMQASPQEACYVGVIESTYSVTELAAIKGKPDFLRSALKAGGFAHKSLLDDVPKSTREEIGPLLEESTRKREEEQRAAREAYGGKAAESKKSYKPRRMSQTAKSTLGSNL